MLLSSQSEVPMIICWILTDPYLCLSPFIDSHHFFSESKVAIVVIQCENGLKSMNKTMNRPLPFLNSQQPISKDRKETESSQMALLALRNLVEVAYSADVGKDGLCSCVVDGDLSQKIRHGNLHMKALELPVVLSIDEDGWVVGQWSPISCHIAQI